MWTKMTRMISSTEHFWHHRRHKHKVDFQQRPLEYNVQVDEGEGNNNESLQEDEDFYHDEYLSVTPQDLMSQFNLDHEDQAKEIFPTAAAAMTFDPALSRSSSTSLPSIYPLTKAALWLPPNKTGTSPMVVNYSPFSINYYAAAAGSISASYDNGSSGFTNGSSSLGSMATTLTTAAAGGSGTEVPIEFPGKNIIIPLYTLIFLLSIIGNLSVILTLARNRRMRTVTNVFLLNLAVSDLLLGVFCMPFTLIGQILRNFIFGNFMCRIIPYFQALSVSVGVWTLVAISLERYFAICKPLQSRKWQTRSHAYKMIAGVWICTLVWNSPITFVSQLQPMGNSGRFRCRENWPNTESEKVFNLILDFLLLLIPLCIMGLAYSLIASKLWKGLKSELRHTKAACHQKQGSPANFPSENSAELSSHSHYSNCKLPSNSTVGVCGDSSNIRKSVSRDFVQNEILTLRGGKGVVVRWKRKDAVEVTNGATATTTPTAICEIQPTTTDTRHNNHHLLHPHHPHHHYQNHQNHNHHHNHHHHLSNGNHKTTPGELLKGRGLNFSRAIRSTYTGKSIESKKKVIRMLFVLVMEFFVCWSPLYVMQTWWLFHPEGVYNTLSPLGVSLIQLLAYVSSCCNPVTYCFMNRKFRQAFLKLFQCILPFGRRKSGPPTIGRGSDLSANDSLVFGVQGTTMNNKSEVVVLEREDRV